MEWLKWEVVGIMAIIATFAWGIFTHRSRTSRLDTVLQDQKEMKIGLTGDITDPSKPCIMTMIQNYGEELKRNKREHNLLFDTQRDHERRIKEI